MSEGDAVAAHAPQTGTVEREDAAGVASPADARAEVSRRQFLDALGTGAATAVGTSETASGQQQPTVAMGSNYFDPVGLHVEPGTTVRFEIADGSHSATAYPDRIPEGAAAYDSGVISRQYRLRRGPSGRLHQSRSSLSGATEREYMDEHGTCSCRTVQMEDVPRAKAV